VLALKRCPRIDVGVSHVEEVDATLALTCVDDFARLSEVDSLIVRVVAVQRQR
jgi:hypothetical protein